MRPERRALWAATSLMLAACGGAGAPGTSSEPSLPSVPAASAPQSEPAETDSGSSGLLVPRPIGDGDANLGYYEYLPPSYGDGGPRPLLVALHGADGSGDGGLAELDNLFETGIPDLMRSDAWPTDRPFVVLFPQHERPLSPPEIYAACEGVPLFGSCLMEIQHQAGHPVDESVCMTPTELHAFLTFAVATYDVDPQRVYLTGLSCGAFTAYEYAARYGDDQIAAMAPIAGEARPAWLTAGCTLGEVAIWAFHGDRDDVLDVQGTIEPMNDLMDCPGLPEPGVELTIYPGVDHDSWTRTYDLTAGHDIYAWFLGIERAERQEGDAP